MSNKRAGSNKYVDPEDDDGWDDDYDYDGEEEEDYYEDDYQSYQKKPAAKVAATVPAKQTKPVSPPQSKVDAELVEPMVPIVREVVTGCTDAAIREAIRKSNYDAEQAIQILTAQQSKAALPLPDKVASPLASEPKPAVVLPKKTGPAKSISIGGKKSAAASTTASPTSSKPPAASPTAASPTAASPAPASNAASPSSRNVGSFPLVYEKNKELEETCDDGKQNITAVIAGHVDHGKSTILGHLMVQLGHVSDRELHKYEQQARQAGKASFHFAWVLDQSEEERRRGVTIDSGVQTFETDTKRVSIFDAPGHKEFVANMISSSTQADVALLVVSAVPNELEVGLNYGTKEHVAILKTLGVGAVIVLINKMDSDTVKFSEDHFRACEVAVRKLLKSVRFKDEEILGFCPVSGLTGLNLTRTATEEMPWYKEAPLLQILDSLPPVKRLTKFPVRLVAHDVTKSSVIGRLDAGTLNVGDSLVFLPSNVRLDVRKIERAGQTIKTATAGDSLEVTTSGDPMTVSVGNIGCPVKAPIQCATVIEARVQFFSTLANSVVPGAQFLMQVHAVNVCVTVVKLKAKMDVKTGQFGKGMVKCLPKESQGLVIFKLDFAVPLEQVEDCKSLGRFVLRQDGETVGGGLVQAINPLPAA